MNIELRKFNHNERLSEETNAFAADLYIDGKKVGYAKNDGRGGCTDYGTYEAACRAKIAEAEAYCKTLPAIKVPRRDGSQFEIPMNLEHYIDQLVESEIKKKFQKKMDKLMECAIVMGTPGASYRYAKYRVPLTQVPTAQLQAAVNQYKAQLRPGEQILNTNLAALGITV